MVAFRARRLVWLAMLLISPTTSPIRCAPSDKVRTTSLVRFASATARFVTWLDCATWRPISVIEALSCSAAAATFPTAALASIAAAVTAAER